MVQDKAILTIADQHEVVYDLSVGADFNPDFKVTPIFDRSL